MTPADSAIEVRLRVNGLDREIDVDPCRLLVEVLRDDLGLTGAHVGCDSSQCGACVVLLNGLAAKACTVLAAQCNESEVTTIEGLSSGSELHRVQAAFQEHHALQCGFCTPGMIMTTVDLLTTNPSPTEAEITEALHGNLCRCTGYVNIVRAVLSLAAHSSSEGGEG